MPRVSIEEFEKRKEAVKKILPKFYGVFFEQEAKKHPEKYPTVDKTDLYNVLNCGVRNLDALECLEDLFLPKEEKKDIKEVKESVSQ